MTFWIVFLLFSLLGKATLFQLLVVMLGGHACDLLADIKGKL